MAPRQILNELLESGSVVDVDGRFRAVRRIFKEMALSPSIIKRLGEVGYRVFSTAAKNIDKEIGGRGNFDRMVHADDGCNQGVLNEFDSFIKPRGQEFLEELDVWFTSRRDQNKPGETRHETGLYMVHYVDDIEEKRNLRDLLVERGAEIDETEE